MSYITNLLIDETLFEKLSKTQKNITWLFKFDDILINIVKEYGDCGYIGNVYMPTVDGVMKYFFPIVIISTSNQFKKWKIHKSLTKFLNKDANEEVTFKLIEFFLISSEYYNLDVEDSEYNNIYCITGITDDELIWNGREDFGQIQYAINK